MDISVTLHICLYTEAYDMVITAKSSILFRYHTKAGFLVVLNELNVAKIPSKQLRSCRIIIKFTVYIVQFKIDFFCYSY